MPNSVINSFLGDAKEDHAYIGREIILSSFPRNFNWISGSVPRLRLRTNAEPPADRGHQAAADVSRKLNAAIQPDPDTARFSNWLAWFNGRFGFVSIDCDKPRNPKPSAVSV